MRFCLIILGTMQQFLCMGRCENFLFLVNLFRHPLVKPSQCKYALYFMLGNTNFSQGPSIEDENLKGIIPRIIGDIFKEVQKAPDYMEFTVKASYLEIYLERIRDLLDGD